MPRHDLHNSIKATTALESQVISSDTTTVGAVIDLRGYESCDFHINYGTLPDSNMAVLIEESASDDPAMGDATAVADGDLLGTEAAAGATQATDQLTKTVGYRGSSRYVRLSIVSTSTTGDNPVGATAVLGGPSNMRVEPDGATPG